MAGYRDDTSMGGTNKEFITTDWDLIRKAQTADQTKRMQIIEILIKKYWKPAYCYLRSKGCSNDQAKDLTQDFFYEIIMKGNLIQYADNEKGRFRDFMKAALNHFHKADHRKKTAKKRSPQKPFVDMDESIIEQIPAEERSAGPDRVLGYSCSCSVIDNVLEQLRTHYYRSGKPRHWKVFAARVAMPILDNKKPPSLKELCKKYDIKDENTASTMIVTVKRLFRSIMEPMEE